MGFFEESVNNLLMNDVVTKALTVKGVFGGGNVSQIIDFVLKYNIDLEPIQRMLWMSVKSLITPSAL